MKLQIAKKLRTVQRPSLHGAVAVAPSISDQFDGARGVVLFQISTQAARTGARSTLDFYGDNVAMVPAVQELNLCPGALPTVSVATDMSVNLVLHEILRDETFEAGILPVLGGIVQIQHMAEQANVG